MNCLFSLCIAISIGRAFMLLYFQSKFIWISSMQFSLVLFFFLNGFWKATLISIKLMCFERVLHFGREREVGCNLLSLLSVGTSHAPSAGAAHFWRCLYVSYKVPLPRTWKFKSCFAISQALRSVLRISIFVLAWMRNSTPKSSKAFRKAIKSVHSCKSRGGGFPLAFD